MKSKLAFGICLVFATLLLTNSGIAQEEYLYPAPPSPEHAILKTDVGVWDADISINGPTGEMKSKGVEKVTMLGELWNVSTFDFDFMGEPTTGHGILGYDPDLGKYVGTWHEAGNPYKSDMIGTYDAEAKKLTYTMTSKDTSGTESEMKIVITYVDDTHKTFEMFAKIPGQEEEMKAMQINYTKRTETETK